MAESTGELDLGLYLTAIKKGWKKTALASVVVAAAALAITLIIAPVYEGRTTLLLEVDDMPMGYSFLGPDAPNPHDIIEGIIKSHPAQTKLREDTKSLTEEGKMMSEDKMDSFLKVRKEYKKNQLIMVVQSQNKELAKATLDSALEALHELDKKVNYSTAARQAEFITGSIAAKEMELQKADQALSEYLLKMVAPSDPTSLNGAAMPLMSLKTLQGELDTVSNQLSEARAMAKESADNALELPTDSPTSIKWRGMITDLQHRLATAKVTFGPEAPEVKKLEGQITETERMAKDEMDKEIEVINRSLSLNIQTLELKKRSLEFQVEQAQVIANAAPEEAREIRQLYRDVATLTEVLVSLKREYEARLVDAEVQKVRWDVLEEPYFRENAVNKRFVLYTAVGFVLGGLVMIFILMARANKSSSAAENVTA